MNLKNLIFGFFIIALAVNCNKKEASVQEEKLSYPFTKEGSLTFSNNGAPFKTIDIEFAQTEAETQQGLMDRDSMSENEGMLFLMPKNQEQTFYMKNTRFPLDLVYISPDSLVVDIQHGTPYNLATIPSDTLSQYVLELNEGMAEKWGIKENQTKVSWTRD